MKNKKTLKGVFIMLVAALFTSIGQFIWKLSTYSIGKFKIIFMLAGFALFILNGFLVVYSYRFGELSVLQPILSCGFVFSLILGKVFFNEHHSLYKYIGIVLILIGVFILARSKSKS